MQTKIIIDMAVTRLKRKDRRNKAVANNKVEAIKILKQRPTIKLVDVEESKLHLLNNNLLLKLEPVFITGFFLFNNNLTLFI